jgi:hypothetical protein
MKNSNSSHRSIDIDKFCVVGVADPVASAISGGVSVGVVADVTVTSDSTYAVTISRSRAISTPAGDSISGMGLAIASGVNPSVNVNVFGDGIGVGDQQIEHLQNHFFRQRFERFGGRQGIYHHHRSF